MTTKTSCLACGGPTTATDEFCNDQCRGRGARHCPQCQITLRRRADETPGRFRRRRYCGAVCQSVGMAAAKRQSWLDPDSRARMVRGMRLAATPEAAQIARDRMLRNWQRPAFASAVRSQEHRHGTIAAETVRAIRLDTRASRQIAQETGISRTHILRIRRREVYKDVE